MKLAEVLPNSFSYNSAAKPFVALGDYKKVEQLMANLRSDGLAFDILPTMDGVKSTPLTNQQISETLADLTLLEPHRFRNRLQVAPIFSGISIHAQISLSVAPTAEGFTEALEDSEWVEFRNALPSLRTTTGYPDVLIGQVEMNPWIQGVELQLQADNVALAVHNALMVLKQLNTMELL